MIRSLLAHHASISSGLWWMWCELRVCVWEVAALCFCVCVCYAVCSLKVAHVLCVVLDHSDACSADKSYTYTHAHRFVQDSFRSVLCWLKPGVFALLSVTHRLGDIFDSGVKQWRLKCLVGWLMLYWAEFQCFHFLFESG